MYNNNFKIKKLLNLSILIITLIYSFSNHFDFFAINIIFSEKNKHFEKLSESKNLSSDKWIVLTAFNSPSSFMIQLEKIVKDYKIVVIGNNETNDIEWNIFKSSKSLFYLSIHEQKYLNYNILKYLKQVSYYRKSIGYLYAIQHGAKEIFEIDEDIEFNDISNLKNYFNNTFVSYVSRNDSLMVNPYSHFGDGNIWPRGFRIDNIGKQVEKNFYFANSSNIHLKPLIFQGLINYYPDVDSIFYLTKEKHNNQYSFNISKNNPLIYFPNNYIPLNSKNTRYLYKIFPLLMFPISLSENVADIWRGYIIQYFTWRMGGTIMYYNCGSFRKSKPKIFYDLIKEKKNYFELNDFLDFLVSYTKNDINDNILELLNNFLDILVDKGMIEMQDRYIYKAFLKDLKNIGYDFTHFRNEGISNNHSNYLKTNSSFQIYIPTNLFIMKNNNLKLINHFSPKKVYKDILLIINYNKEGFFDLNEYLLKLYNKYFPNIIFISPNFTSEDNTISCIESYIGYYSYKCFKKVYIKYPNYKGYLFINDDLFLKVWELGDFDFSIPWLNPFYPISKNLYHYPRCYKLYNLLEYNFEWKNNLIAVNGYLDIFYGKADFYYLPNYYALKICNLFEKMFQFKLFLECAIPVSMGILLSPKYQIIKITILGGKEREKAINYLFSYSNQIMIHPIKLSNIKSRRKVIQYIVFINAKEY